MRLVAIMLALTAVGCVSTSRFNEEVGTLRQELNQEKSKLQKTQAIVCMQGLQMCIFTASLQAALSGQEVDATNIQRQCIVRANQCHKTLESK